MGEVRQSAVLEKAKQGQETHQYSDRLEKETEREIGSNENPSGGPYVDADGHEDVTVWEPTSAKTVAGNATP